MIMVGANSVLTTKVIRENTRKRFTEVAVAVEEIRNSMTLTLKALAEGKQDIDHLYTDRMVTVRGSGSGIWTVVTLLPETIVIKFYLKSFKALNLLTLM